MNAITTTHNLDFFAAPYEPIGLFAKILKPDGWMSFKIGTCDGVYMFTDTSIDIIAIQNNEMNNGHFEDVLQWFEFAAKRDKKDLRFMEILNAKFGKHLVKKRGFVWQGVNAIKKFK